MIIEEIIEFLKKSPPFQFLEEDDLQGIATSLTMEFYPKGTLILRQGEKNIEALRIIKKGAVKVFMKNSAGDEIVIDYRGEGDNFGLWSIVTEEGQKTNVVATEDTICFLLDKERVLQLLEKNAAFAEYFLKAHLSKYLDKTFKEMLQRSLTISESDRMLFTTTVEDIASKDVITASIDSSIQHIANLMSQYKISSIVVVDEKNIPVGIVTDRDLREKVVAKGRNVSESVKNIMSLPLIRIDANDYCYEAILKMIRHKIHHLLVIKDGSLIGILTNHDLMLLQGTSPLAIAREIESQQTISGLAPLSKKITRMVGLLLKEGARATNIARIVSEINDSLIRRVLEIAEKRFGKPPVPYCFIVYGSEGRKEQTFKTDQDNAIIYADPPTERDASVVKEYFEDFSKFIINSLLECGFPLCSGNYMANNPRWRQPLSVWKQYFTDWIVMPTPEAILSSVILFDFRPVYGDAELAESLRKHLLDTLKDHDIFLVYMAKMTVNVRPPIGIFRTFVVEKSGEHKDLLNLKFRCIAPILNIVRLFALEKRIPETSTIERIKTLKESHETIKEFGDELQQAFEFLMLLRIQHQLSQIDEGKTPDNFINPDKLSNLEKKTLKDVCKLISDIQEIIEQRYMLGRMV
jgi:CBS domain-containing protein